MLTKENTTTDTPESEAPASAPESTPAAAPAAGGEVDNQSVDSLAAELSRSRRARRAPASAKPTGEPKPEPQADATEGETPEPKSEDATDETSATSEPDDDSEDQDDASEDEQDKPKAVRELQRRIDKKTAAIKAKDEEILRLRAEVDQLKQAPPKPAPASDKPFAGHADVVDIDTEAEQLQEHLDWLDANPDGGKYEVDGKVIYEDVPADKVPRLQRRIERRLAELSALRATKVDGLRAQHAKAMDDGWKSAIQTYPWLNDPKSPQHAEAVKIVKGLPPAVAEVLGSFPEGRMFLGDVVAARLARASNPAGAKPAARPTPPRTLGAAASAAPSRDPQAGLRRQLADAEAALEKSGSMNDLKRVESLKRQLRLVR